MSSSTQMLQYKWPQFDISVGTVVRSSQHTEHFTVRPCDNGCEEVFLLLILSFSLYSLISTQSETEKILENSAHKRESIKVIRLRNAEIVILSAE